MNTTLADHVLDLAQEYNDRADALRQERAAMDHHAYPILSRDALHAMEREADRLDGRATSLRAQVQQQQDAGNDYTTWCQSHQAGTIHSGESGRCVPCMMTAERMTLGQP